MDIETLRRKIIQIASTADQHTLESMLAMKPSDRDEPLELTAEQWIELEKRSLEYRQGQGSYHTAEASISQIRKVLTAHVSAGS